MSAVAPVKLQIPDAWTEALPYLADLRQRMPLSSADWQELYDWLSRTKFDEQNCLAGEVAGVLIRDFAPANVRRQLSMLLSQRSFPARLKTLLAGISAEEESRVGA
jgi:hypothetical protein